MRLRTTLLGVIGSLAFVALAARRLEYDEVRETLANANVWPWLPLAVCAYLVGHLIRGIRCRLLVSRAADLPVATATNVVVLGYAVNNVLPARMGELARAGLLSERTGVPFAQSLTVTVVERVLDGWAMILLFALGSWMTTAVDPWINEVSVVAAAILGVFTVGIITLLLIPLRLADLASRIAGFLGAVWQERVWRLVIYVASGLRYLRAPREVLALSALSLAVWLIEACMFLCVLPAFGLAPQYDWAILVMAVTNLGILVPSTPGHIGPFHFFCAKALTVLGIGGATAAGYAITVHLVFYVPITVWGVLLVIRYGIEIGGSISAVRSAARAHDVEDVRGIPVHRLGALRAARPLPGAGALVRAITVSLVPSSPELSQAAREDIADFVVGQVASLPPRLRILFSIATVTFRGLVRLRYGRGFCDLSAERQRAIAARWAYGKSSLRRQYFRLFRSTTLLAYFEHAEVRCWLDRSAGALSSPQLAQVQKR